MEQQLSKREWLRQVLAASPIPLNNRDIAAIPEAAERMKRSGAKLANGIAIELAGMTRSKNRGIKRIQTVEGFKYYPANLTLDFAAVKAAVKEAQMKALPEERQRLGVTPFRLKDIIKKAKRIASDRVNKIAAGAIPPPQVAAIVKEAARLREDAERYRWLREHPESEDIYGRMGNELDAAIDAAAKNIAVIPAAPLPLPVPEAAPAPLSAIIENLVNLAVDLITERVTERVTDQVTHQLANAMSGALNRIESKLGNGQAHTEAPRSEAESMPKRRVLIIGPMPVQQAMLKHEFERCFDLRFAEKNEGFKRVKSLAMNCDHIIGWTDFMPHAIERVAKSANPQAYETFKGGMTALRDRLTQIYVNGQSH